LSLIKFDRIPSWVSLEFGLAKIPSQIAFRPVSRMRLWPQSKNSIVEFTLRRSPIALAPSTSKMFLYRFSEIRVLFCFKAYEIWTTPETPILVLLKSKWRIELFIASPVSRYLAPILPKLDFAKFKFWILQAPVGFSPIEN